MGMEKAQEGQGEGWQKTGSRLGKFGGVGGKGISEGWLGGKIGRM